MLSLADAQERVLASVVALEPVSVPVGSAAGLVCARDIYAPENLPGFEGSAMDGYALRSSDLAAAGDPPSFAIFGEVRAGAPVDRELPAGTAVRIMTGGMLPPEADAVVPIEEADERNGRVVIAGDVVPGRYVRPAGEDVKAGELLMRSGTELGPGELGLLAALGMSPLEVHPAPRVAIIVTGDEIVSPEQAPPPGAIRDSNSVALLTLTHQAGGEVVSTERVGDDREATRSALERAAANADLIVSSGGVSVGKYDYVREVVAELGSVDMWKVAMQPGKPVVLGDVAGTKFLGLPGNPVSVHVCFEQFVRPAIRKMRGCTTFLRPRIQALLTDELRKAPGRLQLVRVRLARSGAGWYATPTGAQGSHIRSSLVLCHGLAFFPAEASELAAGQEVTVEVWRLPVATGSGGPLDTEAEVE